MTTATPVVHAYKKADGAKFAIAQCGQRGLAVDMSVTPKSQHLVTCPFCIDALGISQPRIELPEHGELATLDQLNDWLIERKSRVEIRGCTTAKRRGQYVTAVYDATPKTYFIGLALIEGEWMAVIETV